MSEVDTIKALRARLQEAINACKFNEAKQIDMQIKYLQEVQKDNKSYSSLRANQNNYDKVKAKCESDAINCFNEAQNEISNHRQNYQNKLIDIKDHYAIKIEIVEVEHSREYSLCTARSIPQADALKKGAQALARERNYDVAEVLYSESEIKRQTTLEEMQAACDKKYDDLRRKVFEKQASDEQVALRYLQRDLHNVDKKYQANIKKLKNTLKAAAVKYHIPDSTDDSAIFPVLVIDEIQGITFTPPVTPDSNKTPKSTKILSRTSISVSPSVSKK